MGEVVSYFDHPASLRTLIREIAANSDDVHIPRRGDGHILGNIGTSSIFLALEHGELEQVMPEPDQFGNYLCEVKHFAAGQEISVVLAVDTTERKIFILHVEG